MGVIIEFKPKRIIFDSLLDKRYKEYLQSSEWKEKRRLVIQRAEGCCEDCGKYVGNRGEVHHNDYDKLFEESVEDLRYKCADCHEA